MLRKVISKKAYNLAVKHLAALQSKADTDPFFADLRDRFLPSYEAFKTAYLKWQSSEDVSQGGTKQLKEKLKELNKLIEDWDLAIQAVYRDHTWQYKALLPHHRVPYQRGSQQSRINAVSDLILNIGTDASLATLKAEIVAFRTAIEDIQSGKNKKQTDISTGSKAAEDAQKILCTEMMRNLGSMVEHFADDLEEIESYFDLALIRDHEQSDFEGEVKSMTTFSVLKRTLDEDDKVTALWTGPMPATFFAASSKTQTTAPVVFTLTPNEPKTLTAEELGNDKDHAFFNFTNNTEFDGHFELDIN